MTPAATAAWMASCPEWKNVPSPMFCVKCRRSTNGAIPIQGAPSLPIAVMPMVEPTRSSSMSSTIMWHPMPAPTRAPSGTLVLQLCGQPEQKYGDRSTDSGIGSRSRRFCSGASRSPERAEIRSRRPSTMASASRIPQLRMRRRPSGWVLPTTTGWSGPP